MVLEQAPANPGYYCLAFTAIAGVVISLYYYFSIIKAIYWSKEVPDSSPIRLSLPITVTIYACVAGMLYLGLFPGALLQFINQAVLTLR